MHLLLSLLHVKALIVVAHLSGLHHDGSNIMESQAGLLLIRVLLVPALVCVSW